MNPKHSLVFFSVGVVLILGFVLVGIIPMNVISESELNDNHKEHRVIEEAITIQTNSKPIEDMNCTELRDFVMLFEKGWGSAVAIYDEKCT